MLVMSTDLELHELFRPLTLPSGATLRNRVAKAAMEENMAGGAQLPDERLSRCTAAGAPAAPAC